MSTKITAQAYGIPSISTVLVESGQLGNETTASKRAADTGVLLAEIVLNSPSSDRAITAIARMNSLHAPFQRAGKITNPDLLYTLSLFALEPSRWVAKYEWRKLTPLELCAIGTYWRCLGEAMGITWDELPGSQTGWKNGLHWLDEIRKWSEEYERIHMVPDPSNKQLANHTIEILLSSIPQKLRPKVKGYIVALLEERLRKSMM